ncbi:MAG: fasciclin domain-containing protein [Bacteroidota bacterium]
MRCTTSTVLPFLLSILLCLAACQEPPPFIFKGDSRPEEMPDPNHPCVNYDESTNFDDHILDAVRSRSDGQKFLQWLLETETLAPRVYEYLTATGNGPITLLLPTNEAVERFEAEYPDVLDDTDRFLNVLKHHMILINVNFVQFQNDGFQPAMNREPLEYTITNDYCVTFENRARLIMGDDFCDRGVIHLIDEVLIPEKGF